MGHAKFQDVLVQYLCPLAHRFVAEEHASCWQRTISAGRFSAGCRTKVKHACGLLNHIAHHIIDKHRCRLLHIVKPLMQHGVEGEVGSLGQIEAIGAPWHWTFCAMHVKSAGFEFERVEANAH